MRKLFLAALVLLLSASLEAHNVTWPGNPGGSFPGIPMFMYYPGLSSTIRVQPTIGEPCTVVVNITSVSSSLVSAAIVTGNPAVEVDINVQASRAPGGGFETVIVAGEWHATGLPAGNNCDAITPNPFTVTVSVGSPMTFMHRPMVLFTGDPVSTGTGEISADEMDLSLGGPLALRFTRHYGSRLNTASVNSALGPNWMHNFDASLQASGTTATVSFYPGKVVQFQQSGGNWQLATTEMFQYQLASVSGSYQFLDLPNSLVYSFSSTGALTAVQDRNGNTLSVTPGPSGPAAVSDGLGRKLTFSYSQNQLASVQDQTGRSVSFTYSTSTSCTFCGTSGVLTRATDANGNSTSYSYSYNTSSQTVLLVSTRQPAGNTPWTQAFDSAGRVTQQTDSSGFSTSIAFDSPSSGARTITDPLGRVTVNAYGSGGNLASATDPNARSSSYTYDANSRLTSFTDRLGNKTTVSYDSASGYLASQTDALGNATKFTYTAQAQGPFTFYYLSQISFADGTSISYAFDKSGNITSATDQAGKTISYTYNSSGQPLTIANAAGGVTTLTYNSDGTLASSKGPAGDTTVYAFDSQKRLSQIKFADNTTRSATYDAMNRPLTATDERGGVTTFAYDVNGNLKSATDALNQSSSSQYDGNDLVTSVTDPAGNTGKLQYDGVGSVTSSTNPAGETTTYRYDSLNRLVAVVDPAGKATSFSYDNEGNLISTADALGNTSTFTADQLGRPVRTTTPLGETFSRTYDTLGRVTSFTDPLSHVATFTYDARGLISGTALPGGSTVSFAHDALGSLTAFTDPNGNVWARKFDGAGRMLSKTDPLGRAITYSYDARNRVNGITNPLGSSQLTYDAAGNVTQRAYSDGSSLSLTYDKDNHLTAGPGISLGYDNVGRLIASNGLTITRDSAGRMTSLVYASGKAVTYTYDQRGLPSKIVDWAGGTTTLTYDDDGRLVSISRPSGVATQVSYDKDSRVAAITEQNGSNTLSSVSLQRDAAGEIVSTSRTVPQAQTSASGVLTLGYDSANQVAGSTYDGLGRVTKDSLLSYNWDLASRLTSYSGATGSASFTYDAFGSRISRTSGGSTQNYVLNYAFTMPSITTVRANGIDQRYYVYLPGGTLLYAVEAIDNSRHYYHFDETGSTLFLTSDTGAVTDSYGVTPYGETVTASGSTPNPFTWLGQWGVMQEGTTGLYYMRARYYDSTTARFLSRDQIDLSFTAEMNPYQYANGDPLSNIDPTGLKPQSPGWLGSIFTTSNAAWVGDFALSNAGNIGDVGKLINSDFLQSAGDAGKMISSFYKTGTAYGKLNPGDPTTEVKFIGAVAKTTLKAGEFGFKFASSVQWDRWAGFVVQGEAYAGPAVNAVINAEKYASTAKALGTAGKVVGVLVDVGSAVAQDIHNDAGVVITGTDVIATGTTDVALMAVNPVIGTVDSLTGGNFSGSIHNALMTPNTVAQVALGRVNTQRQDAIKATYTRFAVGRWAWYAGEYWYSKIVGD